MAKLSAAEFFKVPSKTRPNRKQIVLDKFKASQPFEMDDGKMVTFKYDRVTYDKIEKLQPGNSSLYNNLSVKGTDGKIYYLKNIKKNKEFGGGGGSGAGADLTAVTESGQCYVSSIVYNILKREIVWEDLSYKNLKDASQYVYASESLESIIEKSPPEWVQSYIKTANITFKNYKMEPGKKVYFHRGSDFMSAVYKAKKVVFDADKKSKTPQAPGTFSDDKWNPGDIWQTTLTTVPKISTDSWASLNKDVYDLAKSKKLLAVSLKKVGDKAHIEEYNELTVKQLKEYRYEGFRVSSSTERGQMPPFFNSIDLYMNVSGREIQFRATSGEAGWQGEIKGDTAAGGKIGGGNVNYYLKKHTGKGIFNNSESEVINFTKSKDFYKEFYSLYKKHFKEADLSGKPVSLEEFQQLVKEKQKESLSYSFSKYINMKFIDIFLSKSQNIRNKIATDFFRYAASNTDQSSFFIKVS
jgi:hypothetical protein